MSYVQTGQDQGGHSKGQTEEDCSKPAKLVTKDTSKQSSDPGLEATPLHPRTYKISKEVIRVLEEPSEHCLMV